MRNSESLKIIPWAALGDRAEITINRSTGWTQVFSQIGGRAVDREQFNQMLCEITSMLDEINKSGILEWSNSTAYHHPAFVVGSDGILYRSLSGSTNINPIIPNNASWEPFVNA